MKKLTITINTENDAFEDNLQEEISRILHELADKIESGSCPMTLRDINGNHVGVIETE